MAVVIIGDSLTFHGPERAEPLDHPRLWPNVLGTILGVEVEVFAREGWTARDGWWALTKDPRLWSSLPAADVVLLALGSMDQLPVALPTYLRLGINHLPVPGARDRARRVYQQLNPPLVRWLGGPWRTLPQARTDEYLSRCVTALRVVRPELPLVGVVVPPWRSRYYPSTRPHQAAVNAALAWGRRESVVLADWREVVEPHVPHGLNPDGMHWGWTCHADIAAATAAVLRPLLGP